MNIERNFTSSVTPELCVNTLQQEGALLLRNFIATSTQSALAYQVLSHNLQPVDRTNHTIPEQFDDIGWRFRESPQTVIRVGQDIAKLVRPALSSWFINEVRGQLYKPGEVGIEWHRDYKRDLRVVAVASFIGAAQFDIELDHQDASWQLEPGDLVLMRGALLNGLQDDRPRHRVHAPLEGQRLSVAYRQVASEVPNLEVKS